MGVIFYVMEDDEKIISLTDYSIDGLEVVSDTFTQENSRLYYDEFSKTIELKGKILSGSTQEDDDVKKLINWAVLPANDLKHCKKVYFEIFKESENGQKILFNQELLESAFVQTYYEYFDISEGAVSFCMTLKSQKKPVKV